LTLYCVVVIARSALWTEGLNDRRRSSVIPGYGVNDLAMLIVSVLPLFLCLWRRPARLWARLLLTPIAVLLMRTR